MSATARPFRLHIQDSAIDEWLERNLLTVDTPKKLRLARLLLHKFSGQELIRADDIAEHLKLVA